MNGGFNAVCVVVPMAIADGLLYVQIGIRDSLERNGPLMVMLPIGVESGPDHLVLYSSHVLISFLTPFWSLLPLS